MKPHLFGLAAAGAMVLAASAAAVSAPGPAIAGQELVLRSAVSDHDSVSEKEALAECPEGTRVLGGGGFIVNAGDRVHLTRLQPLANSNRFAAGATEYGSYQEDWRVYAYAICGPAPAGLQYVSYSTVRDSSTVKLADARCPGNKTAISSGFRIYGGRGEVKIVWSYPGYHTGAAAAIEDKSGTTAYWRLWAFAVCADMDAVKPDEKQTNSEAKTVYVPCDLGDQLYGLGASIGSPEEDQGEHHLVAAYPNRGLTSATVIAVEHPGGVSSDWTLGGIAACG